MNLKLAYPGTRPNGWHDWRRGPGDRSPGPAGRHRPSCDPQGFKFGLDLLEASGLTPGRARWNPGGGDPELQDVRVAGGDSGPAWTIGGSVLSMLEWEQVLTQCHHLREGPEKAGTDRSESTAGQMA